MTNERLCVHNVTFNGATPDTLQTYRSGAMLDYLGAG